MDCKRGMRPGSARNFDAIKSLRGGKKGGETLLGDLKTALLEVGILLVVELLSMSPYR